MNEMNDVQFENEADVTIRTGIQAGDSEGFLGSGNFTSGGGGLGSGNATGGANGGG
jgi:hypothetical protein